MSDMSQTQIKTNGTGDITGTSLHWADYLVIVGYFLAVLVVGLVSSWRSKRDSVDGYFLASRSMNWIPVGASLFASNIGSGHFIGLAGSGAASGIGIATFEMNAIFILILLGWVFVPVYMAAGVFTMPEYLRARFGGQRIRVFLSILALLLYVFTKISADLYAGALFIKLAMNLQGEEGLYLSILALLAIAAIFTIGGGLSAVIWTDFVQTILMIIGALWLMIISFSKVGGYEALIDQYKNAEPLPEFVSFKNDSDGNMVSCSAVDEDKFMHFLRPANVDSGDLPWTGLFTGMVISSIWYWCADQVIVQRTLSAKNISHAKAGCVLASLLKFLPLFLLVFPGMAARVLFKNEVACSEPSKCKDICGSEAGCTNIAYVKLVLELMPRGARGLMLAVMMAALMSSLTSIFNSSSTIFTMDIWTRIRRKPSDTELLVVGRTFVIFLVAISIAWIPIITKFNSSQLFVYIQAISNFLSPQVAAVFLLGVFWKRTNEQGAFWGLIFGFILGIIRFGVEFGYNKPGCGSGDVDLRPNFVKVFVDDIHYLHYGAILFIFTGIVTIIISLMTEPIPDEKIVRLTFWTRKSKSVRVGFDDEGNGENILQEDVTVYEKQRKEEITGIKKVIYMICGIPRDQQQVVSKAPKKTKEEEAFEAAEFLHEKSSLKIIINVSAVLSMSLACFVVAFYA